MMPRSAPSANDVTAKMIRDARDAVDWNAVRADGRELLAAALKHPDFLAFRDKAQRGTRPKLRPRDVPGEQLTMVVGLLAGEIRLYPSSTFERDAYAGIEAESRVMASGIVANAVPYLWRRDLAILALSSPLPRMMIRDLHLPHESVYWSVDEDLTLKPDVADRKFDPFDVYGWCVRSDEKGVEIITFGAGSDGGPPVAQLAIYGPSARYPGEVPEIHAVVLKLAAFVNSPYVNIEKHRSEPHNRKQRRRYGPRIGDPMAVNVITLRSEVREAVRVERGEGPQWKQRWLVRGHYRAQWYPATRTHRVIWIAPYLKGPEDAPVKLPLYSVVR